MLAKVGAMAYKLDLPPSSIHPVFHVSQLKKALAPLVSVAQLPDSLAGFQVPEQVLQRRLSSDDNPQILVKWLGLSSSLATWEDLSALQQAFPHAPACGQAGLHRGGNVSTLAPQKKLEEAGRAGGEDGMNGPGRSTRVRRPNVRVTGPEWVTA